MFISSILRLQSVSEIYLLLNTILSSNKRVSFKLLQSGGQLGRARSIMSNLNEIFKGGNKENNQSGSSDSDSSYVSSSSDDHNRNKSKKKASKTSRKYGDFNPL